MSLVPYSPQALRPVPLAEEEPHMQLDGQAPEDVSRTLFHQRFIFDESLKKCKKWRLEIKEEIAEKGYSDCHNFFEPIDPNRIG